MSWGSRKENEGSFCTVYFVLKKFFNICVLSQCILYWIHFQNTHTFTYQKTLLHALFCLFLKSSKAFNVSTKNRFHVVSTWNTRGVFLGVSLSKADNSYNYENFDSSFLQIPNKTNEAPLKLRFWEKIACHMWQKSCEISFLCPQFLSGIRSYTCICRRAVLVKFRLTHFHCIQNKFFSLFVSFNLGVLYEKLHKKCLAVSAYNK